MSEGDFESTLSSVLGNEELMNKISSVISANNGDKDASLPEVIQLLSSTVGAENEGSRGEEDEKKKSDVREVSKKGRDFSKNARLLSALRPYLSEKRAMMIDSILKIEQIAEIMKLTR